MTWQRRYRIRHNLENSIWVLPVLAIMTAMVSVAALHQIETKLGWESSIDPETARVVLGMLASSMFTFIVFISSALLVALQLASGQLTPRIIALAFSQRVIRWSLAIFVFNFTFALAVVVRIKISVPLLTTYVAAYGSIASLALFLFLIDQAGKWLRPSGALRSVSSEGRQIILRVYPRLINQAPESLRTAAKRLEGQPTRTIANLRDGVLLAFDMPGLVSLAERTDCIIDLVPQVGDFVAAQEPLFQVFQGTEHPSEDTLRQYVAFGQERTLEQDPTFAFRIIVDIACKALSPAINDPTTAVIALDQIHHLLRTVGNRHLADGREADASGRLRLVYRTPDWEDFVRLAVTEIRQYGGESIQVTRRLRAMLENLIQTLPEKRVPLLSQELSVVQRSAKRFFKEPEDRALAVVSDLQGMGGGSEEPPGGEVAS